MLRFCSLSLKIMEKAVEIREAVREDCPAIRALIQELADFEEMPDGPKIDYQTLEKYGFSSDVPLFKSYVAVCDDMVIGYALYFYIYFTPDQKVVHLEDLYVNPDYRKKNVGSRLFNAVAKRTFDEKCSYLDFAVLSWNPAQSFYKNRGSMDLTEMEGWHAYRIDSFEKFRQNRVSNSYTIRKADLKDFTSISILAQEATRQKKETKRQEVSLKIEDFRNDVSGDANPHFDYIVVELNKNIVGYALYCFVFSTWTGKAMYLQEFYVSPSDQESSIKRDLLTAVVKEAEDEKCSRIDFWVLDVKNEGQFFSAQGAEDFTIKEEWHLYRLFELPRKQLS